MLRPIDEKSVDVILYICSIKERSVVYNLIDTMDFNKISEDISITAEDDNPFLLSHVHPN